MLTEQVQANSIDKHFKQAFNKQQDFVSPDSLQLQQFQNTFTQELQSSNQDKVWMSLGFKRQAESPFIFLSEMETQGRGFIVLRSENSKPWLLQAPHAKSDLYTGKIASRLFLEGEFKAVIWNSLPRKKIDVAHLYQSHWQAVTQAFSVQYPQGRIIQIHGFSAKKRKSLVAQNSDMIVSAGHLFPPLWVQKVVECLKAKTVLKVSLYSYDVNELGATKNSQSQLLQSLGHQGFIHLEMNKKLREDLLKNAALRKQLLVCLAEDE
ncbi:MAG: hypothetical protein GQ569_01720 [Methylococcaceae bacterium]|nr:hypothetical protein [Methylococcaceae bacterium]